MKSYVASNGNRCAGNKITKKDYSWVRNLELKDTVIMPGIRGRIGSLMVLDFEDTIYIGKSAWLYRKL